MRAARAVAAGGAFVWSVYFFGLVDLSTAIGETPGFYDSYVLEAGWGLLFTVLVSVPLVVLAFRPGKPALLLQLTLAGVAVGLTSLASLYLLQLIPAIALVLNAAFAADLSRGYVKPPAGWSRPTYDVPLAFMAVVAAPGCLLYAVDMVQALHERRPPVSITMGLDHWPMQAALAVAVVLIAGAVAVGTSHGWAGTLVSAWTVAATATWLGALSVVYPDHAGSLGTVGGALAVAWGLSFGVLAVLRQHRGHAHQGGLVHHGYDGQD